MATTTIRIHTPAAIPNPAAEHNSLFITFLLMYDASRVSGIPPAKISGTMQKSRRLCNNLFHVFLEAVLGHFLGKKRAWFKSWVTVLGG